MIDTNYWYYGQIRLLILHTLRLFQNFCVSEGIDENGNPILRRVPCVYMSTDKSVVYMLNNATDTVLETCPKMVLSISNVKLNNDKISGSPYYAYETSITEKRFDKNSGNYVYEPGNSYNITRLNPLPLGIEFRLYILTSMQEQKFQLFEQIRSLFSPTLELQTSENPLDWSRVTAITLTNMNWSSIGTSNLDSTTLDAMDMTFAVDTNLDMPSLVQKERMIEQITNSIGEGNSLEDIMSWSLEDITRTFHSPNNNRVSAFIDENGKQCLKLEPSEKCKDWFSLLQLYGIKYNKETKNININCLTNSNVDFRNDIVGSIIINEINPSIAYWTINQDSLPSTNIQPINQIISPHDFILPKNIQENTRYLITSDISNCSMWGDFYNDDGITKIDNNGLIKENSIIEYKNGKWCLSLDPNKILGAYYLTDISEPNKIYTYNNNYKTWVDVINQTYPICYWRIGERNK